MAAELTRLIARLCVTAGMLMEDVSTAAVSTISSTQSVREKQIEDLRQAGADIAALLAAAEVLHRHAHLSSE